MPNDDALTPAQRKRNAYLDGALTLLLASLTRYGELSPGEGAELRSILAAAYDEGEERGRPREGKGTEQNRHPGFEKAFTQADVCAALAAAPEGGKT